MRGDACEKFQEFLRLRLGATALLRVVTKAASLVTIVVTIWRG
jgi:hypothetical protein